MYRRALSCVVLLGWLLAGCSAGEETSSSRQVEAAVTTPSPTQVAKVSTATTCQLIFTQGVLPLWDQAISLAEQSSYSASDAPRASQLAEDLDEVAASAKRLEPFITMMADDVRALGQLIEGGGGTKDFDDFRTAGTELGNVCAVHVADLVD